MKSNRKYQASNTVHREMTRAEQNVVVDLDKRTIALCFSSELPVERWYGDEILLHGPENIDLSRLNSGGAFLADHNWTDQIGVVDSVTIDADKRARAVIRFSKSARASEIFEDMATGIRQNVSVGYRIIDGLEEIKDGRDILNVTKWQPLEISVVSVPADPTVGVGRSENDNLLQEKKRGYFMDEEQKRQQAELAKAKAKADQAAADEALKTARKEAGEAEAKRIKEIYAVATRFGMLKDAEAAVNNNTEVESFQRSVLEKLSNQPKSGIERAEDPSIGMHDKEKERYSFVRLLNALSNPGDTRAQKEAAFEFECADAAVEKMGKSNRAQGLVIPHDVLTHQRAVTVGGTGGNLVAENLLTGSFIDLLRSQSVLLMPGMATFLPGLTGNVAIPAMTGGATGYWVAENANVGESDITFGQVALTPKTMGTFTDLSRRLLKQSSPEVETLVRQELALRMAITLSKAAIAGTGINNEPTGILNTSGIGSVAIGTNGGALTYDKIVDLETLVDESEALLGNLCYLTNAKVRGAMKKIAVESGDPLKLIKALDYELKVTSQVPKDLTKGTADSVCSALLFGNFADLLIGMWGGLDVNVDTATNSRSGAVRIVVLQDADVAVRHPESFAAIQDITTA